MYIWCSNEYLQLLDVDHHPKIVYSAHVHCNETTGDPVWHIGAILKPQLRISADTENRPETSGLSFTVFKITLTGITLCTVTKSEGLLVNAGRWPAATS